MSAGATYPCIITHTPTPGIYVPYYGMFLLYIKLGNIFVLDEIGG